MELEDSRGNLPSPTFPEYTVLVVVILRDEEVGVGRKGSGEREGV